MVKKYYIEVKNIYNFRIFKQRERRERLLSFKNGENIYNFQDVNPLLK